MTTKHKVLEDQRYYCDKCKVAPATVFIRSVDPNDNKDYCWHCWHQIEKRRY